MIYIYIYIIIRTCMTVLQNNSKRASLSNAVITRTGVAQGSTGVPWRPNTGLGMTSVGSPIASALTVAIAAANRQRALLQLFNASRPSTFSRVPTLRTRRVRSRRRQCPFA